MNPRPTLSKAPNVFRSKPRSCQALAHPDDQCADSLRVRFGSRFHRSSLEVFGDGVDLVRPFCVDVWVVLQVAAVGVLSYVIELVEVVFGISYAVLMEARLPDCAWKFCGKGVSEAAFDALDAALDGLVACGS